MSEPDSSPMESPKLGADATPDPATPSVPVTEAATGDLAPSAPATAGADPSTEAPAEAAPAVGEPVESIEAPATPAPPEDSRAQVEAANQAVRSDSRRHTRRAFVVAAAGAAAGYGFYQWIDRSQGIEMQPAPFRRTFQNNAAIARAVFQERAFAPTYALKDAKDLRVNGVYGLKKMLAPESWRLQLVGARNDSTHPRFFRDVTAWEYRYVDAATHEDQGHDTKVDPNARTAEKMAPEPMLNQAKAEEERAVRMPRGREEAGESRSTLMPGTPGLLLTMEDILKLPRHELVTQFKCIEGWSEIVHWAGVRMADFLDAYPPASIGGSDPKYVYMETPDGDYYTGYDMDVCRHPQTLLVTEMMGAPLTQYHGAPLRLHMPIKYGYKQIKRIGLISYTNEKPDDYWTKLGYDWYAGL